MIWKHQQKQKLANNKQTRPDDLAAPVRLHLRHRAYGVCRWRDRNFLRGRVATDRMDDEMSGKLPAIQFYVGDWLRDPVSGCSLAAQGLWLRMMILMHDSDTYGRLECGGNPLPVAVIARRCGCSPSEFKRSFDELLAVGVPSIDENKIIFNRRMVRDFEKREADKIRKREQRRGATDGKFSANGDDAPIQQSNSIEWPDLKTVLARADMIGCKPEWAEKFFDHYDSQGWMKPNGLKISNWQTQLKIWTEKNRAGEQSGGEGAPKTAAQSLYLLNGREQGLKSELAEIDADAYYEAGGAKTWTDPKDRKRYFEITRELKAIAQEKQKV